ncbi:MAG: helix-turn-helix domain-containing protein [Panacagrimonas sp.]
MNDSPAHSAPLVTALTSPGAAIRAARKQAGMSIEELATRTRLAKPTLEAMEIDAFDKLIEPVYARGYYRKCAGALGLSEKPLIAAYDTMYKPPAKPPLARISLGSDGELKSSSRRGGSSRLAILVLPLAMVVAVVIWLWSDSKVPAPTAPTVTIIDPLASAPVVTPESAAAPATDASVASEPATGDTAAVEGSSESFVAEGEEIVAPAETPAPAAAASSVDAGSPQLVLVFNALSFARVEDASGKSLLSGVISAGERKTLQGKLPYSIVLGNAAAVSVEYAGKSVDLAPYTKPNSTARFSLPGT